ncbi:MAG: P-loop NTPase [Deltaproteobacteria bacterium]|nr:P-loop NTPase [Deltaproteobacteria bacterium]
MKSYHDIAGDGGSDVIGQVVAKRAQIAESLADVRHMVAIGSGKGGVGKSTLTMQLAQALRAGGSRVAILDADLNGPTQARLGGLRTAPVVPGPRGIVPPKTANGIGVVSMGALFPESEAVDFDSVARGDSYVWRATREFSAFGDLLAGVGWGALDFLLVDLPPGPERTFQYAEFLGAAAAFVLVTIPSDVSRGVVSRAVAAMRKTPNRVLGYVENMSGYFCGGCDVVRPLFPVASPVVDLGIPRLGAVPFDPELAAACDRGATLADARRPALRAIHAVAAEVARLLEVRA